MKRLLAFVLTTLMMLSCASPAMAKAEFRAARDEFPDVNMDGELNVDDVKAILNCVAGRDSLELIDPVAADRDNDGRITSYDAYLLVLWLQENGYMGGGKDLNSRVTARTNYNPPQAVEECPFVADYNWNGTPLRLSYVNRNRPTNGLVAIDYDRDLTSVDGIGYDSGYVIGFFQDNEKGVLHIAYARVSENAQGDNRTLYAGFQGPYDDTEYVCYVYERNQFLSMSRSYRVFVEGQ